MTHAVDNDISIHAPRVGRDNVPVVIRHILRISIHAPRVGRDNNGRTAVYMPMIFQSTRPVWGATVFDSKSPFMLRNFNPRAPCGARHKTGKA